VPHFWPLLPEVGIFVWIGKKHMGAAAIGYPAQRSGSENEL
jgi:hypothetical protein